LRKKLINIKNDFFFIVERLITIHFVFSFIDNSLLNLETETSTPIKFFYQNIKTLKNMDHTLKFLKI
jgi:hypothetical protein